MSLYTMLRNHETPSEDMLEEYLGGNLCRCTGYRPIIDAAKSVRPSSPSFPVLSFPQ